MKFVKLEVLGTYNEIVDLDFEETFPKTRVLTANTTLSDYNEDGVYYFSSDYTPTDIPSGLNGWLINMMNVSGSSGGAQKQLWYRQGTADSNDWQTYERTYTGSTWGSWQKMMAWNTERVTLTSSDGTTIGYKWGRVIVLIFNGLTSSGLTSVIQNFDYTPTKTFSCPILINVSSVHYLGYVYMSSTASDSYVCYYSSYGSGTGAKRSTSTDTCYGTCAYITNVND